jgi:hypothetical protein
MYAGLKSLGKVGAWNLHIPTLHGNLEEYL